ncbi:MAG: deoxyguanosinetriphosphate triphosphohydrolase [Sedimentisphaerales bacterium]|nr:deoxyguanosinetriphosphate triphosphohydrolase [Sedimentisphaerales bacterium]
MSEKLASYAVDLNNTRNRRFTEPPHPYRGPFERDRDRIMHSSAFRMLEGKTQVFTPGLNDHYRTRLTHSIEVAQIGRTIANALNLNQNLTEAICLGHDLGHSPFGHAGEKVLNDIMADFGGFEHNLQTLRIVDLLEHPYPDFDGLNLMYETRLGFAKHHSPYDSPQQSEFKQAQCSFEGQIADIADRIAYNCHDLEDGLRANLITEDKLRQLELCDIAQKKINARAIEEPSIRRTRTAKTIIDYLVSDCLLSSKKLIENENITSLQQIYSAKAPLICLSPTAQTQLKQLEDYLLNNMYTHPGLIESAKKSRQWLSKLFDSCCRNPDSMPPFYQKLISQFSVQRAVCDYIAGMTDRFCLSLLNEI